MHDAAWMCGWRRYRVADRCGGCGCDLADVLGGLFPVVSGRSVAGHAGKRQATLMVAIGCATRKRRGMMSPVFDRLR